jgi:O-antigen/teichoic acid export membrane protein
MRALAIVALLSVPALAAFAAVPTVLLRIAFGADYESGDAVLLPLGAAFALLAATYVAVQFLLGLHKRAFVAWLAVVAVAEPLLLYDAGSLETFAARVLVVQAVGAVLVVGTAAATRRAAPADDEPLPGPG